MGKNKKQVWIAVAVLAAAVLAALGLWLGFGRPSGSAGIKHIEVTVSFSAEEQKVHQISTDAEFLGQALTEEKIIEGEEGPYGLFITSADGVKAEESLQQWWCITKGGEDVVTGADLTPIADGDRFELTLKTGY